MIARGQIYFVDLDPTQGREQSGRRPVLVVSADSINRHPLVVTVVVGTDAVHVTRDYPINIRVPASESGLPKDTVFLAFQIRSLDSARPLGCEVETPTAVDPGLPEVFRTAIGAAA